MIQKVNQRVLNLINQIQPKLTGKSDLIPRQNNQSCLKRKCNYIQPKIIMFRKLPVHSKPKHPYIESYGAKAKVMRQRRKAKITLPDEPSAAYCDIETEQVLEGFFFMSVF